MAHKTRRTFLSTLAGSAAFAATARVAALSREADPLSRQHTGANYAMHPPSQKAAKPVGQWNHTRIVVNRGHVEHWLNGVKVVDYEMWTTDCQRRVQAGKWKDYPGYGKARRGKIGLQDHGNKIWFRNIKIRA